MRPNMPLGSVSGRRAISDKTPAIRGVGAFPARMLLTSTGLNVLFKNIRRVKEIPGIKNPLFFSGRVDRRVKGKVALIQFFLRMYSAADLRDIIAGAEG